MNQTLGGQEIPYSWDLTGAGLIDFLVYQNYKKSKKCKAVIEGVAPPLWEHLVNALANKKALVNVDIGNARGFKDSSKVRTLE